MRRVQLTDHQPQNGAHFIGIARPFDERRVSLADRVPVGAVVVRVGIIVALGGPGLFEYRHLFLVEVDVHLGIDIHRARLLVFHPDGRHVSVLQVEDIVRIGGKLRVRAHGRSVGQLPCRTARAAASATRPTASAAPADLFFQRIEVQIGLSAGRAAIQQILAIGADHRVIDGKAGGVQRGQPFANMVEFELHFHRRLGLRQERRLRRVHRFRLRRWPPRPGHRERAPVQA